MSDRGFEEAFIEPPAQANSRNPRTGKLVSARNGDRLHSAAEKVPNRELRREGPQRPPVTSCARMQDEAEVQGMSGQQIVLRRKSLHGRTPKIKSPFITSSISPSSSAGAASRSRTLVGSRSQPRHASRTVALSSDAAQVSVCVLGKLSSEYFALFTRQARRFTTPSPLQRRHFAACIATPSVSCEQDVSLKLVVLGGDDPVVVKIDANVASLDGIKYKDVSPITCPA